MSIFNFLNKHLACLATIRILYQISYSIICSLIKISNSCSGERCTFENCLLIENYLLKILYFKNNFLLNLLLRHPRAKNFNRIISLVQSSSFLEFLFELLALAILILSIYTDRRKSENFSDRLSFRTTIPAL